MIKPDKGICLRCSGCVGVCPVSALTLREHGIECNEDCIKCGICVNFCPVQALSLEGKGD
jgi:ferredoxin